MSETSIVPDAPCLSSTFPDINESIRRRAEEIYIQSGRIPGRDLENWAQAEREVLHATRTPSHRPAIVVNVNGRRYVGEYRRESCDGYIPGEFGQGTPIPVRFDGDKMFVRRPNGKELETVVVNKIINPGPVR